MTEKRAIDDCVDGLIYFLFCCNEMVTLPKISVFVLIREEQFQRVHVWHLAHGVADEEEEQRRGDADGDLVQGEDLEAQGHRHAVSDHAAEHGADGAGTVGLMPEQAEDHDPEECGFQAAEGEHVDLPDNGRRRDRNQVNAKAQEDGEHHAQPFYAVVAQGLAALFQMTHVHVLDDGRRRGEQQGRNGRDGCRNGPDDDHAGPERTHDADDGTGHDIVHAAAVSRQVRVGEHAFAQDAYPGGDDGHHADDYRTDDDSLPQRLCIFIADAADNGLGQRQGADAYQQPLADVQGNGHLAAGQRLQHGRVVSPEVSHDGAVTAGLVQHAVEQDRHTDHHGDGADGVGDSHAFKPADGSIDDYDDAEHGEAGHVGIPGNRFEQFGRAHELGDHGSAEECDDKNSGHVGQYVGFIPGADDVDDSDGVDVAGHKGDLLAEDAHDQEDDHHLHDGHVQPAVPDLPGDAGPAYKGRNAGVGGHGGHSQDETAQGTAADEIILYKVGRTGFAGLLLYPVADVKQGGQE